MASQLAALQMMSQAQSAAHSVEDQMEMDREKDPAKKAPWYAMACCGGDEVIGETPDKTLEEMDAEATASKYERMTLRINIFSGTNIPSSYSTYIGVEITDIDQKHEDFSPNDEGPSRTPTWGQSFEFPLTFSTGMILEAKITVWGRSLLHGNLDRQLGECIVLEAISKLKLHCCPRSFPPRQTACRCQAPPSPFITSLLLQQQAAVLPAIALLGYCQQRHTSPRTEKLIEEDSKALTWEKTSVAASAQRTTDVFLINRRTSIVGD